MPLFKIDQKKLKQIKAKEFIREKELQTLVESNLEATLGIKFMATEFRTTDGDIIDTLGLDENSSPVIIEYKKGQNQNIINQGLHYLEWLVRHKGDYEMLAQKKFGHSMKISWNNPRLILIANSFNKFDISAANRIVGNIELRQYIRYGDDILLLEDIRLPRATKSRKPITRGLKEFTLEYHLNKVKDKKVLSRINAIRESIAAIDENIKEHYSQDHIIFRKSINFCSIYCQRKQFWVDVRLSRGKIETKTLDIRPHQDKIFSHIRIHPDTNLDLLVSLIKKAYKESL